ncbi:MAG: tol-pal system protein YbgF [Bdellovibrionales bacterium]
MIKHPLLASSALMIALVLVAPPLCAAQDEEAPYAANAASTGMEMRLSVVEDQMRALTGKVEQIDYAMRRIDTALQKMQSDADARLTKLESVPPAAIPAAAPPLLPSASGTPSPYRDEDEPTATGIPEPDQAPVSGTLGGVKVRGDKVTGAVAGAKAPPLPAKPADYGLTPQEQYERAFGLLRQANYDEAEKAFKSFIAKNPKDRLIDNAKYWHAETYYVRAKFGDAAAAFAEAYQQNPKGTKAPDSLLKMAMSLGSIEKTEDACNTLSALKSKYPNAAPTIRARADQERSKLKCK